MKKHVIEIVLMITAIVLLTTGCSQVSAAEGTHYTVDGYEMMDFHPYTRPDYTCTANLSTGGVSCYPSR